jgi:hypothetical protein
VATPSIYSPPWPPRDLMKQAPPHLYSAALPQPRPFSGSQPFQFILNLRVVLRPPPSHAYNLRTRLGRDPIPIITPFSQFILNNDGTKFLLLLACVNFKTYCIRARHMCVYMHAHMCHFI